MKKRPYTLEDLEQVILDVLDGYDRHDFIGMGGMSYERAIEIERLVEQVVEETDKEIEQV